ncbi:hypothetical protein AZH53_03125 [Methanomicrobiaceae archaeon CYW5]|nr:hypothetical protein [Methanovulcanius yangii]
MFAHQENVFDAISEGNHCLVSTGTGSGKTESFLYPIIDHCFRLKDEQVPPGIVAVIVYPMNALAIDQLERLRGLLAGTGITFGMYVGSTKRKNSDVANVERMQKGEGREAYSRYYGKYGNHKNLIVIPHEEKISVEEMHEEPPRILLTNINQLEYLLTRPSDLKMIENSLLKFLVLDEAHTYTGSRGAEVALLIRRLRAFADTTADEVLCIGTSATIVDTKKKTTAPAKFFHRLFGVDPKLVTFVEEKYIGTSYPHDTFHTKPIGSAAPAFFEYTLDAIDGPGDPAAVSGILRKLGLPELSNEKSWKEELYETLLHSDIIPEIEASLSSPKNLWGATHDIWNVLKRPIPREEEAAELLTWLALGATAEKDNHPLLRPQVHFFIRGLAGTVGILGEPVESETPVNIYFSHAKAEKLNPNPRLQTTGIFPVVSCKKCGQHYFEIAVDEIGEEEKLHGGISEGENVYWPPAKENEGIKLTFTNRFVSEAEADDEDVADKLAKKRQEAYICRFCGTIHLKSSEQCLYCHVQQPVVPIYVLNKHGIIAKCPVCLFGAPSSKQSALRALSAVQVADIHILAQSMINAENAENRKLILFADNRQDAAFQAAWMSDHARRYRFRHLLFEIISKAEIPVAIGDLVETLTALFKMNPDLGRAVATEVYERGIEESYSSRTEESMKKYLRISILRELTTSFSQRDSLETWGKIGIAYFGLEESNPTIESFAARYQMSTEDAVNLLGSLCDYLRRSRILWDEKEPIYSHWWHRGMPEIQRKFIPYFDFPPKGVKIHRETVDKQQYVAGLTSSRGRTTVYDFIKKIGIDEEHIDQCIEDVWNILTRDLGILIPVTLTSQKGKPLPGATGVYQVDARKIGILPQNERYRCVVCNRIHSKMTPNERCMKIHCKGHLVREGPPEDDYNVSLLNHDFTMLIAREHTAQVPSDERQEIEQSFKDKNGTINCLVATPTLELGIDVGELDMVLMRNVPPLPSNYWQRAGRAGRRHRMAVIFTYSLKKPHDEYFFEDPMRLLGGTIYPPHINLKNPVMIRKHVHSAIISEIILTEMHADQGKAAKIKAIRETCLPPYISGYLFEPSRLIRQTPPDLTSLEGLITQLNPKICTRIQQVFSENWPEDSIDEVQSEILSDYVNSFVNDLRSHIALIHKRLLWAKKTRDSLTEKERNVSQLDEMDSRLLNRCRDYILGLGEKKLDNYTLNVLANSGFLPGYALHPGSVTGIASESFSYGWKKYMFELSRPESLAIREFVPGNLLYANGGKYRAIWYHLPFGEKGIDPDRYVVDLATMRVFLGQSGADGYANNEEITVPGVAICDTELGFVSLVSDEEQNRFKMPVVMGGIIQRNHRGIDHYAAGEREFSHRHGQDVRLINLGPSDKVREGQLGYPLCLVCGASRSPYASNTELENFYEFHETKCGKKPELFCFSADARVDGFLFERCETRSDAINLAEGLKIAANVSLEMEPDDLEFIILMHDEEQADVFLYDPMPGGSGILDQIIDQWDHIIERGIYSLNSCTNNCETACYECMKSYGNMQNHELLNRMRAAQLLNSIKSPLKKTSSVPSVEEEQASEGESTNTAEMRLSALMQEYGLPPFDRQKEIQLPQVNITTTPDFYYESLDNSVRIAIYLDGLSRFIHGDPEIQRKDQFIRTVLRSNGYIVVEISATALDDPEMMKYKLMEIGIALEN